MTSTPVLGNKRFRADLGLMFCTILWGSTFVVVKNSLDNSSVFLFLALRFTLAGILMALWRPQVFASIEREEIFAGLRLGFFMFAGYAFQTAGLQYTSASNSGFVTGSSVVLVPLLFGIFWGHRLTIWVYAGALAAGFGLYYLTIPAEGVAHLNKGDVLTFVAAASYAVHIILVSEYTKQHSASALSVLQVIACAGMAWIMTGIAAAIRWQPVRFVPSWSLLLGISICAVFATAVAFSIQLWAQQYTTPGHAAILFTLEPVFAVLTSYIFLGERLAMRAIFGAAFVLAGILIAELLGPAAAPESSEPMKTA
ncbi:MAG TPA: DMT family transporter [Candidatus Dormibacteraeota bacterium]|jgi:drug/metabolite transporter (DMT)-like permease|nr:DMT family transporter [Candidatus Dormibacteraeota bacterium]